MLNRRQASIARLLVGADEGGGAAFLLPGFGLDGLGLPLGFGVSGGFGSGVGVHPDHGPRGELGLEGAPKVTPAGAPGTPSLDPCAVVRTPRLRRWRRCEMRSSPSPSSPSSSSSSSSSSSKPMWGGSASRPSSSTRATPPSPESCEPFRTFVGVSSFSSPGGTPSSGGISLKFVPSLGSGTISPPPALRVSPGKHPGTMEQWGVTHILLPSKHR